MRNVPFFLRQRHGGFTLAEMLVVISLLILIAATAVPAYWHPDRELKLDRAAQAVATAIRFAQSESIRTGDAYGLTVSQVTQRVTVSKYDLTTAPISAAETAINPFDKQPYDFNVNTQRATAGVTISNSDDAFEFAGLGPRRSLIFDAWGTPKWIVASSSTTYLLDTGEVELSYQDLGRSVVVAPVTGRVSIE